VAHNDFLELNKGPRDSPWLQWADFGMKISPGLQQGFLDFVSTRAGMGFNIRAVTHEGFGIEARAVIASVEQGQPKYRLIADTGEVSTRYVVGGSVLDADLKADTPWARITRDPNYAKACVEEFEGLWANGRDL